MLGAGLIVPLIFTDTIKLKYQYTEVALITPSMPLREKTPPVEPPLVAPRLRTESRPAPVEIRQPELPKHEVVERKIETKIEPPKPKPVTREPVRSAGFDRIEAAPPAPPKPVVRTGGFSDSVAAGEMGARTRTVQTGGFGDPNGAAATGRPDKIANIASLGSFDLPAGGGGGGGGGRETGRSVQSGGFSDLNASASGSGSRSVSRDVGPVETPVEITFKPRPDYTEEARQLRLEGEVLIRVLFRATGEVNILEIVRSLGHGLDQNAIRAAQQIRFKPASRQKQAVDSTAIVHIVFQLAY